MNFVLHLNKNKRIQSATTAQFASVYPPDSIVYVESLPEGDISEYLYIDGEYVHSPRPQPAPVTPVPTQLDRIEAQVTYTAMMTDTLLEDE